MDCVLNDIKCNYFNNLMFRITYYLTIKSLFISDTVKSNIIILYKREYTRGKYLRTNYITYNKSTTLYKGFNGKNYYTYSELLQDL